MPTKVRLVKAVVFPVVMYGCESWTVKKAEHWRIDAFGFFLGFFLFFFFVFFFRIDAFELWYWRRLLRVPWTAKRSNQSILKKINSEDSLEGLMLKLKLQYFGHLIWRADSSEKTLMLGKTEGSRKRGRQRMKWLDGITDSMDTSLSKLGDDEGQRNPACCSPWACKESDMTEWLNNKSPIGNKVQLPISWKELKKKKLAEVV